MEIVIGIVVGLAVGAVIAVIAMRNAKNGSLREADSRIESARAEADQVIGEAQRQAETLKKEALLEAKQASCGGGGKAAQARASHAREPHHAARGIA